MEKEWFREWFDENYLHIYCHRDTNDAKKQIDLILKKISPGKNDKILDLGCGEGRHVCLLSEKGYNVTGLDLSETLLKKGREKHCRINLIRGDMRKIPGKFNIILSLFTSFGYFARDSENVDVVKGIYNSLEKNGHFWLDFLNSEYVKEHIVNKNIFKLEDGSEVTEVRNIHDNRVVKDITIDKEGIQKKYRESVRLFSYKELKDILSGSGFKIQNIYGNYDGQIWDMNSRRTIIHSVRKS